MKFMHLADIHLGAAPDKGFAWAQGRDREIWESFRRCMDDANEKNVDLILIAGDLFHQPPRLQEIKEVNSLFAGLEKAVVVLIAGNHDYLTEDSPYRNFHWAENVVPLFSPTCERVRLPQLKTEIYGLSYYSQEIREPLYDRLMAENSPYFSILLAHGGDAGHIPMNRDALLHSGFDYIALGHIHKPSALIEEKAVYPGALEPIDPGDLGAHGYIMGEVHRKHVKLTFEEVCLREYHRLKIPVAEEDTAYSLREKISAAIDRYGAKNMYRIILTGSRAPSMHPNLNAYMECGRITDVEDRTVPALHIEDLHRHYRGSLIGDYIESFGHGEMSPVEEMALQLGLEALLYGEE